MSNNNINQHNNNQHNNNSNNSHNATNQPINNNNINQNNPNNHTNNGISIARSAVSKKRTTITPDNHNKKRKTRKQKAILPTCINVQKNGVSQMTLTQGDFTCKKISIEKNIINTNEKNIINVSPVKASSYRSEYQNYKYTTDISNLDTDNNDNNKESESESSVISSESEVVLEKVIKASSKRKEVLSDSDSNESEDLLNGGLKLI